MQYRWDPNDAERNRERFGVDFADAATALTDERALTMEDPDDGAPTMVTLGQDANGWILVVRFKRLTDVLHILEARTATELETQRYEAHQ